MIPLLKKPHSFEYFLFKFGFHLHSFWHKNEIPFMIKTFWISNREAVKVQNIYFLVRIGGYAPNSATLNMQTTPSWYSHGAGSLAWSWSVWHPLFQTRLGSVKVSHLPITMILPYPILMAAQTPRYIIKFPQETLKFEKIEAHWSYVNQAQLPYSYPSYNVTFLKFVWVERGSSNNRRCCLLWLLQVFFGKSKSIRFLLKDDSKRFPPKRSFCWALTLIVWL